MSAGLEAKVARRLQPKFRMVANGDTDVNVLRAEQCSAVALTPKRAAESRPPRRRRQRVDSAEITSSALRKKLTERADAVVSLFVQLDDDRVVTDLGQTPLTAVKGAVGTAELPVKKAIELAMHDRVAFAELGQPLVVPVPHLTSGSVSAPGMADRRVADTARHKYGGVAVHSQAQHQICRLFPSSKGFGEVVQSNVDLGKEPLEATLVSKTPVSRVLALVHPLSKSGKKSKDTGR